mmetsp:Transcript_12463/g.20689  ORF Transcript_12463/g.20689 Transcript_12463/m.20689 type:complete len:329 (+) Transcript_12463:128-1114(+)|eukprot:CAMPEP_0119022526 /NCGR_PEP_ID=MMETSP1176-20130426/28215_1 /TAXON_ID=265551 /ORGANISM="Synedropsis recta cf, Strain CCMP1620" /LENGTH=328 /DNA_ID=CAMNT_0006977413 /DNA_START=116 /DNA_END=1105 /DNA_ORIENTATION=-
MRAGADKAVIAASLLVLLSAPCASFITAPSSRGARWQQVMSTGPHHHPLLRDTKTDAKTRDTRPNRFTCQMAAKKAATADDDNNKNDRIKGSTSSLKSLEQKIEGLVQRLKDEPDEMLEEEAVKLEAELRQEILTLRHRLEEADVARQKDKELQKSMEKEQKVLEKEIASLKKQYKEGTDWKNLYEEAEMKSKKKEKESRAEIKRLEQEVRVVFSVGRRTSDKMVEDLGTRVKEKQEKLQITVNELNTKKEYIIDLEDERNSLRQLLRLSWRLTSQRLRLRLTVLRKVLRKKIMGGPLSPIADDTTSKEKSFERQAIRVRKSRRSSES